MKSWWVFLLVAILMVGVIAVFLFPEQTFGFFDKISSWGGEDDSDGDTTTVEVGVAGGDSIGGGSADGGGSSGVDSGVDSGPNLPADLETRNCGFYVDEYEVCAGVCPEGTCVSEGNSCYCKKV